jgi:hypothetical protein
LVALPDTESAESLPETVRANCHKDSGKPLRSQDIKVFVSSQNRNTQAVFQAVQSAYAIGNALPHIPEKLNAYFCMASSANHNNF